MGFSGNRNTVGPQTPIYSCLLFLQAVSESASNIAGLKKFISFQVAIRAMSFLLTYFFFFLNILPSLLLSFPPFVLFLHSLFLPFLTFLFPFPPSSFLANLSISAIFLVVPLPRYVVVWSPAKLADFGVCILIATYPHM